MKYTSTRISLLAFVATVLALVTTAHASYTEKVIYSFQTNSSDVAGPGGIVADSAGNLYGSGFRGGAFGFGGIFELSPTSSGWTETLIYSFSGGTDGSGSGPLTIDASGNLYGTDLGGATQQGEIFELSHSSTGWTKTSLYSFSGGSDGVLPQPPLIFDSSGNLYGTASGGVNNQGLVFELSPSSTGWTQTVLYAFSLGAHGFFPNGKLSIDSAGRLYGFTFFGGTSDNCGSSGCGTVYRLSPPANGGSWTYRPLFGFDLNDGGMPSDNNNLVFDGAGNLYGCTAFGGAYMSEAGAGVIFTLSPSAGSWTETILHSFSGGNDGYEPDSLAFDSAGHLWGTAINGGSGGEGTVFELTRAGHFIFAYDFQGGSDGASPQTNLVFDSAGNVYGTTVLGGTSDGGTVFELSPSSANK